MVTLMKKSLLLLLLVPALASAGAVGPKKVYSVSKNGTLYRGQPSTTYNVVGSTIQGTAVTTDVYVSASRSVNLNAPNFEVPGKVIDAVQVKKSDILSSAKGMMKSGLKANAYGAIASILAGVAIQKGWEWLDEQQAWVKGEPTYPTVNCKISNRTFGNDQTFTGASPDICKNIYSTPPDCCTLQSVKQVANNTSSRAWDFVFKNKSTGWTINVRVDSIFSGGAQDNKVPVPEGEINSEVENSIKGKEGQIVTDDITNGLELPYEAPHDFTNSGNQPAYSPNTVTSTSTKTNPDGTTETTTVSEQKKYDYKPSGGDSISPSVTTTTTTTTINNTTNSRVTNVTNKFDSPEKAKEEDKKEEQEQPPISPAPEFPEIKDPELSEEKLPQLVAPTIMGFPTIPTSFSCTNPDYDMGLWRTTLPMCDWIEKFRALFEWFWMMSTAVAIYVIARGTNLNDGKS